MGLVINCNVDKRLFFFFSPSKATHPLNQITTGSVEGVLNDSE